MACGQASLCVKRVGNAAVTLYCRTSARVGNKYACGWDGMYKSHLDAHRRPLAQLDGGGGGSAHRMAVRSALVDKKLKSCGCHRHWMTCNVC
jgi:hypothetical protein